MNKIKSEAYWKKNLKYLVILLSIWFSVSFGFGILLVDELNQIQFSVSNLVSGLLSKDQYMYLSLVNFCIHISNE